MLDQTYFTMKSVIEMIQEMNLTVFLDTPLVDNLISGFWLGPYE